MTSAIQRDVLIKLNMYNAFTRDATKLINKTICHKLEGKQSFQSHQIREAFKETAIIVTFFLSHLTHTLRKETGTVNIAKAPQGLALVID